MAGICSSEFACVAPLEYHESTEPKLEGGSLRHLAILLIIVFAAAGCGESSHSDDGIDIQTGGTNGGPGNVGEVDDVRAAIDAFNGSLDALVEHTCACYSTTEAERVECVEDSDFTWQASSCEEEAAACDVDDFTAMAGCMTRAREAYKECLTPCPTDVDVVEACRAELDAADEACFQANNSYYVHVGKCSNGADSPTCGTQEEGELPTEGGGGTGGDQCETFFREQIAAGENSFFATYRLDDNEQYAGTKCECYDWCAFHWIEFRPDNTYYQNWQRANYCDYQFPYWDGFCEAGTWEIPACNEFRMTTCQGVVTEGTWRVEEGELILYAQEWYQDGYLRSFEEAYRPGKLDENDYSVGLGPGDCYGDICNVW